jgi:hypothetical protein
VLQCCGPVGRADRSGRLPVDSRSGAAGRSPVPDACGDLGRLQAQQVSVGDPAPRGHVRLCPGGHQQAAEFRRPEIRARPAGTQARAGGPGHQLQRSLPRSLPHHASARRRHHGPGLRTHGGTTGRLRRRSTRLGAVQA